MEQGQPLVIYGFDNRHHLHPPPYPLSTLSLMVESFWGEMGFAALHVCPLHLCPPRLSAHGIFVGIFLATSLFSRVTHPSSNKPNSSSEHIFLCSLPGIPSLSFLQTQSLSIFQLQDEFSLQAIFPVFLVLIVLAIYTAHLALNSLPYYFVLL